MGAFLDKPVIEKLNDNGSGNNLKYALSSMQGWRVDMEDAHKATISLSEHNLPTWSFFTVCDGHAGGGASLETAQQLQSSIINNEIFQRHLTMDAYSTEAHDLIIEAIKDSFFTLDKNLRNSEPVICGFDRSGSTCVCVIITPTHYYFANCGDSRALLIRNKMVYFATKDHKPNDEIERDRIINAGGSVVLQRVNGTLAVSRSLGDFDYKHVTNKSASEQLVSAEPDVTIIERDMEADEFVFLACDGVWDILSNDELNNFVQHRLNITEDLVVLCNDLIDCCLHKGSRDNMSAILITCHGCPKIDDAVKEQDEKLNIEIKEKIDDYFANKTEIIGQELIELISYIDSLKLTGLPPGGLVSKRSIVIDRFNEICDEKYRNSINEDALSTSTSST